MNQMQPPEKDGKVGQAQRQNKDKHSTRPYLKKYENEIKAHWTKIETKRKQAQAQERLEERLEERYDEKERAQFATQYQNELDAWQASVDEVSKLYINAWRDEVFQLAIQYDYSNTDDHIQIASTAKTYSRERISMSGDIDSVNDKIRTLSSCLMCRPTDRLPELAPSPNVKPTFDGTQQLWKDLLEDPKSQLYQVFTAQNQSLLETLAQKVTDPNEDLSKLYLIIKTIKGAWGDKRLPFDSVIEAMGHLFIAANTANNMLTRVLPAQTKRALNISYSLVMYQLTGYEVVHVKYTPSVFDYGQIVNAHVANRLNQLSAKVSGSFHKASVKEVRAAISSEVRAHTLTPDYQRITFNANGAVLLQHVDTFSKAQLDDIRAQLHGAASGTPLPGDHRPRLIVGDEVFEEINGNIQRTAILDGDRPLFIQSGVADESTAGSWRREGQLLLRYDEALVEGKLQHAPNRASGPNTLPAQQTPYVHQFASEQVSIKQGTLTIVDGTPAPVHPPSSTGFTTKMVNPLKAPGKADFLFSIGAFIFQMQALQKTAMP